MTDHPRPHLDEDEMVALAAGRSPGQHSAHLGSCRRCRDAVELWRELRGSAMPEAPASRTCPEPVQLLRHCALAPAARRRSPLAAHLRRCRDCSQELAGLLRLDAEAAALPVHRGPSVVASLLARLRGLVAFEMPTPILLEPRSAAARTPTPVGRDALRRYRAGRYDEAAAALRRAIAADDPTPGLHLYLGASLLCLGRAAAAARALEPAATPGQAGAEARWYLAQALLQLGRGDQAREQLLAVARSRGPYRDAARALAGRVDAILAGGRTPPAARRRGQPAPRRSPRRESGGR